MLLRRKYLSILSSAYRDSECRCFESSFSLDGGITTSNQQESHLKCLFCVLLAVSHNCTQACELPLLVSWSAIIPLWAFPVSQHFLSSYGPRKPVKSIICWSYIDDFSNISTVSVPILHIIHWFLQADVV